MTRWTVRTERAGEAAAIRAVVREAFAGDLEAGIVDALRGTDRWIEGGSLVAEPSRAAGASPEAARLVGHLLLSEGDLVDLAGALVRRVWMVGPVAVVPSQQRQGVGAALMRAAIGLAERRSQPVLCLLGHGDYYPRFGFRPARALGILPPAAWADANWLALPLSTWEPGLRGVAHFAPAFAAGGSGQDTPAV